ncbi:MAG: rod shape-determining protein RodA [Candidatus Doudnabacteria bacterium]|nr:rod shape-determining protein RodA [Candidatus Doudnabacteria bacterium]
MLLLLLGLLMIYSTTLSSQGSLFVRQIVFAVCGIAAMLFLAFFDYRDLKKITGWAYVAIIVSLVLVWLLAEPIRGSARWIDLGFFRFQPAEFTKLIMVIVTAKVLDQHREKIKDFRYLFLSLIYVLIPIALILIQPDLGSAIVIFLTWLGMISFSRIKKMHLVWIFVGLLATAVVAWFFLLHDYQKERIYTFLDPSSDPQGSGYNVIQSIIAVGSGEYFGRGVGRGLQSQLKFLPERQTDFIFASTAEELGFVGSLLILALFFLILYRLVKLMSSTRDNFGMYVTLGIFFMFLIEILVNVGMNVGLLPVTGIPLPLLSYGGSSLLTVFLALGIIQSIAQRRKIIKFGG